MHSLTRTGPAFAGVRSGAAAPGTDAERARGADTRTLRGLYAAHHADVLRAAHRITGDLQDAEDVVQTVFLRIARGMNTGEAGAGPKRTRSTADGGSNAGGTFDGVENPGGYLQRSAVNAALDLVRARIRRPSIALDPAQAVESGTESGDETSIDGGALRERLRRAVAALHPSTAEVFALRYFEGFTNRQIADMLGTSQSSVGVSLHRARTQLKRALTDDFDG